MVPFTWMEMAREEIGFGGASETFKWRCDI